jgi:hypothetical protein
VLGDAVAWATGMADSERIVTALSETADAMSQQLDVARRRSVELHRAGADEDAVMAETALAVAAAKALGCLTGEDWDDRLQPGVGEEPEPPGGA